MILYVSSFGHRLFWCRSSFHIRMNCLYLNSCIWSRNISKSSLYKSCALRFGRWVVYLQVVYLLILCPTRPIQTSCPNWPRVNDSYQILWSRFSEGGLFIRTHIFMTLYWKLIFIGNRSVSAKTAAVGALWLTLVMVFSFLRGTCSSSPIGSPRNQTSLAYSVIGRICMSNTLR